MSKFHLILGAGPVGRSVAAALLDLGETVVVGTRSATVVDGARSRAVDASDAKAVTEAATGAVSIINCVNPPYDKWQTVWPPIAAAILAAAKTSGAVLVTMSNLYGYGDPGGAAMSERTPLAPNSKKGVVRAKMWDDAFAAHQASVAKVVEARASDFIGPGLGDNSHMGDRVTKRAATGKNVKVIGATDQPHTFTYIGDVGRMLAVLATNEHTWGRVWHVPSNEARTVEQVVNDMTDAAGHQRVKVTSMPNWLLRAAGVFVSNLRELREVQYQFDRLFVMDSTDAVTELGLEPTPWDQIIAASIEEHSGSGNVSKCRASRH